jgi:DNA-binding CsgD family transcriptional regulator
MDNLYEIIKGRSAPGMVVFDINNRLLYLNREALDILPELQRIGKGEKRQGVLKEMHILCNRIKRDTAIRSTDLNCAVFHGETGPCSMRAFFMGSPEGKNPTHIMVLLERIILGHKVDLEKMMAEFKLTKRESEVLQCICEGLSNKDISEKLFIAEYTVKDHIKKIMMKMNVNSRTGIIAHTR